MSPSNLVLLTHSPYLNPISSHIRKTFAPEGCLCGFFFFLANKAQHSRRWSGEAFSFGRLPHDLGPLSFSERRGEAFLGGQRGVHALDMKDLVAAPSVCPHPMISRDCHMTRDCLGFQLLTCGEPASALGHGDRLIIKM